MKQNKEKETKISVEKLMKKAKKIMHRKNSCEGRVLMMHGATQAALGLVLP